MDEKRDWDLHAGSPPDGAPATSEGDRAPSVDIDLDLVRTIGHELQNPLHVISMTAETLQGNEDPRVARSVERIRRQAARLKLLLRSLVDYSHVHLSGELALQRTPAHLAGICEKAVARAHASRSDLPIEVSIEGDDSGHWDGERLQEAIAELLVVALDLGKGPVSLRCWDDRGLQRVSVVNEEPTVERSAVERMFEPFHGSRGGSPSRTGLGLGLFLAQQIARAHGGQVGLTADSEGGIAFTIEIPRGP